MAVMIDIPGVGEVEAKNAASEETLRQILKALGGKTGGAGGGVNNAAGAAAASKLSKAQGGAATNSSKLGASLGKAFGAVAKFGGAVVGVAGKMIDMSNAISGAMAGYSNLDNNVTAAAAKIPLLGGTFQAAAAATEKATYFGNWLKQTMITCQNFSQKRYIRVLGESFFTPPELTKLENVDNIHIRDFKKSFKI